MTLKSLSCNGGAVDYHALLSGASPFPSLDQSGGFLLYRIGDAVASRNVHAGIYDAVRFGMAW